jgi:hypothetical protein
LLEFVLGHGVSPTAKRLNSNGAAQTGQIRRAAGVGSSL